jgi:signal transduction histidine kinase
MEAPKWLLPSLSSIWHQNATTNTYQEKLSDRTVLAYETKANREWLAGIEALQTILTKSLKRPELSQSQSEKLPLQGLLLSAPVPVLSDLELVRDFKTGVFNIDPFMGFMPFQLLPASSCSDLFPQSELWEFPLLPTDPLAKEQFCLVLTSKFSVVLLLGTNSSGLPTFYFSFAPEEILAVWERLQARIRLTSPHYLAQIEAFLHNYAPKAPAYQIVMEFSRLLLEYMSPVIEVDNRDRHYYQRENHTVTKPALPPYALDLELLQALTHEIRTPLATIKTLTQLLLRRKDLAPEAIKRLEAIEYECCQQINRMELIFRAVELANSGFADTQLVHLTSTSLHHLLEQSVPQWQKQALRHNVTLDVLLPQKMPTVVSNPVMLEQVLTGLMETFTRRLPTGGKIQVHVTPAGDRLKLQFQSQPYQTEDPTVPKLEQKSLGQLLIFQPETGSISLNLNVTKNLCQILGGKLIFRKRPATGEELTIFLPLEMNRSTADLTTT